MTRFVKSPKTIGWKLSAGSEQGCFAQGFLKCLQCPGRIAGHEKTKPVKLRQTTRESLGFFGFQSRSVCRPHPLRARRFAFLLLLLLLVIVLGPFRCDREHEHEHELIEPRRFQSSPNFLGVGAAVESADPKIAFTFRAETATRRDHEIQIVQHPVEHFPAR